MKVEYGTTGDIESWMELVKLVSWNFPGLETEAAIEDHKRTVLRFMNENRALCVKEADKVVGVLLISKKHNMICCLAVAPEYRRNGIASALLEKALAELDRSRDITVTTFRENDQKGTAPRSLYKRFGFVEENLMVENDYPVQRFVLRGRLCSESRINIYGENRYPEHNKVREACRGIVIRDEMILLTYELNTDQWFIPGGGLEDSESIQQCCIRELAEETGYVVNPQHHFVTINEYYEEWLFISHYFICEITGVTQRLLTDREAEAGLEPRWIPLQEAVTIFSKHQDYARDEMKRGSYLREYKALNAYLAMKE